MFNRYERLCELLSIPFGRPFSLESDEYKFPYRYKWFIFDDTGLRVLINDNLKHNRSVSTKDLSWKRVEHRASENIIINLIVGSLKPILIE